MDVVTLWIGAEALVQPCVTRFFLNTGCTDTYITNFLIEWTGAEQCKRKAEGKRGSEIGGGLTFTMLHRSEDTLITAVEQRLELLTLFNSDFNARTHSTGTVRQAATPLLTCVYFPPRVYYPASRHPHVLRSVLYCLLVISHSPCALSCCTRVAVAHGDEHPRPRSVCAEWYADYN